MATILTTLLILLSGALCLFKKSRWAKFFLLVTVIIFMFVGTGLLPGLLLKPLQVYPYIEKPAWSQHNLIIALGGGLVRWADNSTVHSNVIQYARIYEAARLYLSCRKTGASCNILASGGDAQNFGISEARVMRTELTEIGVEFSDILLEEKSNNTFQNAYLSSQVLKKTYFDLVLLVTSGVHLRRSIIYFQHFGLYVTPSPADSLSPIFSIFPVGYNFAISDIVWHEYSGICRYTVYSMLGLNPPVSFKPGAL